MNNHLLTHMARWANPDGAAWLLRLWAGAALLFHNVGKIQQYNEIIGSYPTVLSLPQPVVFTLVALAEVVLATLLLIDIRVRWAAGTLAAGTFARILLGGPDSSASDGMWFGIFLLIAIAGAGPFAWNPSRTHSTEKNDY